MYHKRCRLLRDDPSGETGCCCNPGWFYPALRDKLESHLGRKMHRIVVAVVSLLCLLVPTSTVSNAAPVQRAAWNIVALGDSGTTGKGDATGVGWVGRYARLLRQRLRVRVSVTNLAEEGKSSSKLLSEVRSDPTTRASLKKANIILFGSAAGASLNRADANLEAGSCAGEACYSAELLRWGRDFGRIVTAAAALRGKKKTVLRAVTEANVVPGAQDVIPPFATIELGLYQAATIRQTMCATMKRPGGRCIDVLSAFNGPAGTEDAYATGLMNKMVCCYPSGKGQQLIAQLLFKSGLKPIR
jgi:lysophospholipase L1-like esterase